MYFPNPFAFWNPYMFSDPSFNLLPGLVYHQHDFPFLNENYMKAEVFQAGNSQQGQQVIKQEQKAVLIQQNSQRALMNNQKTKTSFKEQESINLKKAIKNHNVLPNIVNSILSHIRRRSKTGKKVEKIMNKYKLGEDNINQLIGKYYAYQNYLHSKIPKSKHQNSLKYIINHLDPTLKAFTPQQQLFYNRVSRVLILNLLQEDFLLTFLTNRKCSRSSKGDHLKAKHFLIALLKEGVNSLQFFEK